MKVYAKHSALFFLFVFTAYLVSGIAVKAVDYHAAITKTDTAWETTCQKSTHVSHISHADKTLTTPNDFPSQNHHPVEITHCFSSLQILPVNNTFLLEPGQKDRLIHSLPSFLSSQAFVFQEPDPPRLI